MNIEEMVQLNNEKRNKLNDHNLKYYEDMLVYIRLNSKSEQHTEELLLELLDHLLEAQQEGRSAEEVFGENAQAYCEQIISEIPLESKKKQIFFGLYMVFYFLAIISVLNGVIRFGLYSLFNVGTSETTFYIGSGMAIILTNLIIFALFIFIILKWMKSTVFKKTKTWIQFIQVWFLCMFMIGSFFLTLYIMPNMGKEV